MRKRSSEAEYEFEDDPGNAAMEQISRALHDLCQPLTTLQCRLEIAGLIGTAEAYQDAVNLALVECPRLTDGVALMRNIVRTAQRDEEAGQFRSDRR
jgi:hypothetical protein